MERKSNKTELTEVVDSAVDLTHPDQLIKLGWGDVQLLSFGEQVSGMISNVNQSDPGRMLEKSPDTIIDQFLSGNSALIVSTDGQVLYHGTIYPNFENGEQELLGYQVGELGTAITRNIFRGRHLGSRGGNIRKELAYKKWGPTILISTNKKSTASWALEHSGIIANDYYQFPYLSYLTCTCENCSERFGHESCQYRRSSADSTPENLIQIYDRSQGVKQMACTLVMNSPADAQIFEDNCRELHTRLGGVPLESGVITVNSMTRAEEFFDTISQQKT